ncbi:hypothetical protein D9756_004913 [Leucocoprinus leucothites]|uniref:Zinc-finger domain-containing protein n=1 Tax=Leucocoprinus leucothites TaxID=201217 RepID=A0A8H5LKB8_9AGAR|nr:hypothetical protein D9756_004913 [Leucoagaricus leucothites]
MLHAMDLDQDDSSPIFDADKAPSLLAQVSQDVYEHSLGPQSPVQFAPDTSNQSFRPYQSALSSYPLLTSSVSPPPPSDPSDSPRNASSSPLNPDDHSHFSGLVVPDLGPLKVATVMNSLDTSRQLCRYEIPGGGVCRDEGCTNVHISRILAEADGDGFDMSDTDIAQFLLCTMPYEWQKGHNVTINKMIAALTLVRQSASLNTLNFEERVRRALLVLEPPLPVPKTP